MATIATAGLNLILRMTLVAFFAHAPAYAGSAAEPAGATTEQQRMNSANAANVAVGEAMAAVQSAQTATALEESLARLDDAMRRFPDAAADLQAGDFAADYRKRLRQPQAVPQDRGEESRLEVATAFFGVNLGETSASFLDKCRRAGMVPRREDQSVWTVRPPGDSVEIPGAINRNGSVSKTGVLIFEGRVARLSVFVRAEDAPGAMGLVDSIAARYGLQAKEYSSPYYYSYGTEGRLLVDGVAVDLSASFSPGVRNEVHICYFQAELFGRFNSAWDQMKASREAGERARGQERSRRALDGF